MRRDHGPTDGVCWLGGSDRKTMTTDVSLGREERELNVRNYCPNERQDLSAFKGDGRS